MQIYTYVYLYKVLRIVMQWTPEGRRLLTGSSSGEFTLWNGMGFNFETIMQVKKKPFGPPEYNADFLLFFSRFFAFFFCV